MAILSMLSMTKLYEHVQRREKLNWLPRDAEVRNKVRIPRSKGATEILINRRLVNYSNPSILVYSVGRVPQCLGSVI